MTAQILSATTSGFDGKLVDVECDSTKGLPALQIVGLGNKAIDEARDRVRSAIQNSHLEFPAKRITINLAPANLPKHGAHFDLPIAIAILTVSGQLRPEEVANSLFVGELALNGTIRSVPNAIYFSEIAAQSQIKRIFVPKDNAAEAAVIPEIEVYGVTTLGELFLHLKGEHRQQAYNPDHTLNPSKSLLSLDHVHGQMHAKRALMIAAAGQHNLLLTGPPGTGKTLLAKTLPSLLPPLSLSEQIAVTKIYSAAGESSDKLIIDRPFRTPHHTASHISLIGGGNQPRPGEISLAHLGILFLDEIPEYTRQALEALRQPLEDRVITISRAARKVTYPADFMLVATQNPCPCGFLGDSLKECTCTQPQIANYKKRLSGPLLDRIDLTVEVSKIEYDKLLESRKASTVNYRAQILAAREAQYVRYRSSITNAGLQSSNIASVTKLSAEARALLETASERLKLSARSYFKIIKIARTIADLEGSDDIKTQHIAEALQFRPVQ